MANDCIPFYSPGEVLTGFCSANVVGKTFLKISGNRQTSTAGGNVTVATATAAERVVGVAAYDAAKDALVPVHISPGVVVPVTADGAIAAFQEVEVGATGKAKAKAAGVAVGVALTAATDGTDAQIKLY